MDLDEIPLVLCTEGEKRQPGLQLLRCDLELLAQTSRRLRALLFSHTASHRIDRPYQAAEKVCQQKKTVIWFI